ncbi:outer membrane protein [Sphingobacterium spiritivorum ATCC 33300]|uniref:Outer membrane protein n=2 Tax=Sphingobacterium spiritivorum TaxID=258 RepID=A0A380BR29_SPHSI|nr:OmpH family outer membrane protein [Sphingobacterium spiritivorum]EEI89541.1 outer membrane protein [Sphingobacterium spiritivorum ATCC 33300]QQS94574.1 OmpH family outer membrane protein [Sphingobacterium spiritivorum]SUJ04555.1 Outer membrane protein [Sphingobacterium spiritivorum]
MKKIIAIIAFLTLATTATFAQRFAYVDSEYILKHIPEYVSAQKQLDDLSVQWQEQVDAKYGEIEKLYKAYQNDQVLLNEDMRRRREDEIVKKEKEAKEFQRQKFGYEGELYQQRIRLIKPIQDRVAKAIQDLATNQGLDIVLDKGNEVTFLYANPKLDKSNDVITKLGFKPDAALVK